MASARATTPKIGLEVFASYRSLLCSGLVVAPVSLPVRHRQSVSPVIMPITASGLVLRSRDVARHDALADHDDAVGDLEGLLP